MMDAISKLGTKYAGGIIGWEIYEPSNGFYFDPFGALLSFPFSFFEGDFYLLSLSLPLLYLSLSLSFSFSLLLLFDTDFSDF